MNEIEKIVFWITDYSKNNKINSLVIGISGGIDSSVTSTLCAMTGIKTIVVSLPINQNKEQKLLADTHIEWLKEKFDNVNGIEINLDELYDSFKKLFTNKCELCLVNSKSRLRMTTLYHIATENSGLVVGTGNKVEDFGIGFFTKYGDGGVDISPIADFNKTEVRMIAKKLNITEKIILSSPTDGLWDDDRTDEDQIGFTYEEIEWAMEFDGDINNLNEKSKKILNRYKFLNEKNKHKVLPIPFYKR
jgi:NAD+ synthase